MHDNDYNCSRLLFDLDPLRTRYESNLCNWWILQCMYVCIGTVVDCSFAVVFNVQHNTFLNGIEIFLLSYLHSYFLLVPAGMCRCSHSYWLAYIFLQTYKDWLTHTKMVEHCFPRCWLFLKDKFLLDFNWPRSAFSKLSTSKFFYCNFFFHDCMYAFFNKGSIC